MNVAIIGPGIMGQAIGIEFAKAGYKTWIFAKNASQASYIQTLVHSKLDKLNISEIANKLKVVHDLSHLVQFDLIVESITENKAQKQALIKKISKISKSTAIIASNTSSLKIEDIFKDYPYRENTIGMHFFNPPHKMHLVEIAKTSFTSQDTLNTIESITKDMGKFPITIKDSAGYMVNRLLIPFINHACELLNEGFTTIKAIDDAMVKGANHPIGPFKLADLIGVDVVVSILENLNRYHQGPTPHHILKEMVANNHLGIKTSIGFYKY